MAAFMGKDVKKLKAKGGGKWKYMSEQDMLSHSDKFAPYRWVTELLYNIVHITEVWQECIYVVYVEGRRRRYQCC